MNWKRLGEFLQNDEGRFSMMRIVTIMVTITLCFDAFWTFIVLGVVWDFTAWKLLWAIFAIGGKVTEKFVEKFDLKDMLPWFKKKDPVGS